MSDASTKHMIDMYMETAQAPMFLAGFFQSPQRNFHSTESVEIDVVRDDEDVAVVIDDLTSGPRGNESEIYTNKEFIPPMYDEAGAISAFSTLKRAPGENPFTDPNFNARAVLRAMTLMRKVENKIRRAIELQASQVLQTGKLRLKNQAGQDVYLLDFKPKNENFADAAVPWQELGAGAANPILDLTSLSMVVRRNGKHNPNRLIFGAGAWRRFLSYDSVQDYVFTDALKLGTLNPQSRGRGATMMGVIMIGHYRFEAWQYDGHFRNPATGQHEPYVGDLNVIMMSEDARLDLTFGSIPMFEGGRALSVLPERFASSERGLALTTNSWITDDRKHLMVSAGTRPLTIPTAIDTFGCLKVAAS